MNVDVEREREELREITRGFLSTAQDLAAVRQSLDEGYDRKVWQRMAGELGLTAVGLPESLGGTGESLADLVTITEELGRHLDPGPFIPSVVLGARILAATEADNEWLESVINGEKTVSVDIPSLTSSPSSESIEASVHGDKVSLAGVTRNVLHGDSVDDVLLVVKLSEGRTLVRVNTASEGVSVERLPEVDNTRPLSDILFNGAAGEVLGASGAADSLLETVLISARIALAAELVGVAQGALDLTVSYAKERRQFGRPIGSFQSLKHLLVDVMMDIEASRTAVRHAASAVDAHDPEALSLSHLCQAVASDAAIAAGKAAVQVHGAIGFTWEHDAHLFLKRAMSGARLFGTARDNRSKLAELLLD